MAKPLFGKTKKAVMSAMKNHKEPKDHGKENSAKDHKMDEMMGEKEEKEDDESANLADKGVGGSKRDLMGSLARKVKKTY